MRSIAGVAAIVVLVLAVCALGIAALAAGATTKVAQSRSQAQVAQSRALEAKQVARQEAERSRQTIEMMKPANTQAEAMAMVLYQGEKRDTLIAESFVKLAMENYERRRAEQAMKHIYLTLAILFVMGMIWFTWAQRYEAQWKR